MSGVLLLLFGWVPVSALLLLWSARLVGISKPTFPRAMGVIIAGIGTQAVALLFALLDFVLFVVGGVLLYGWVAKLIFDTSYPKALGAVVVAWGLAMGIVAGLILTLILVGVASFDDLHWEWRHYGDPYWVQQAGHLAFTKDTCA